MVDRKLDVLEQHMKELSVARRQGNRQEEGLACFSLGNYFDGIADFKQAIRNYTEALGIFKEIGFRAEEGRVLGNLDLLQGHDLIFVPDGPFCLAPFSAPSDTVRIRTVPSLTALKLITSAPIDFNSKSEVLLVGDPWLKKATWSLAKPIYEQAPYAKEMVELIGKLLHTEAFTCRNATEAQGGDGQFSCRQLSYLNMRSEC